MKRGQELVRIDNGELSIALRGLYVHSLGFQAGSECLPVGGRGNEDHTLPVGNGASREATNGAIEKLLILVELHDVIARPCGGQKSVPRLVHVERAVRFTVWDSVHKVLRLAYVRFD